MSVFRMTVKDGETAPIEFQENVMVTISKGILVKRPLNNAPVIVTIKYTPMQQGYYPQDNREISERLCVFEKDQTDARIENMYYDSMNPKIYVPEGAEVKFEGNFTSAEVFADKEPEEESQSTETPEDEEDGDFQEEESDM